MSGSVATQVLQGFVFLAILLSETLYGRFRIFAPERWRTG